MQLEAYCWLSGGDQQARLIEWNLTPHAKPANMEGAAQTSSLRDEHMTFLCIHI
jgi:hypothetical protein